jgi:hypothetical protein
MNLDAIYEPTPAAAELIENLRFPAVLWHVFEAVSANSACTARALSEHLHISTDEMAAILDQLSNAQLIHAPAVSYAEYLERTPSRAVGSWNGGHRNGNGNGKPTANGSQQSSDTILRTNDASHTPSGLQQAPERKVSFTLRKTPATSGVPRDLAPADTQPASQKPEASLKIAPLIQLVRQHSGDPSLGQFAVYRMFLNVPQHLLLGSGFDQLDLETADAEIKDQELADALRSEACAITGLSLSDLLSRLSGG